MTSKLLNKLKQQISSFELQPSSGGCFELTVDGQLVYSKLQTGDFPNEEELVNQITG